MQKLAIFQGVTTPIADLARAIQQQGWQLGQVKYDNGLGQFTAEAVSPHGEKLTKTGPDQATAVSNALMAVTRRNHMRTTAQYKVGMWRTDWHEKQREIAEAYRDAPIYDPKAVAAWKALGDDSMHRLHVLGGQLHIEPTNDPQPYKSADDMRKDVHDKRHYYLSRAGASHPVWTADQVAAFRGVHDILGHGVSGGGYDWPGRVLAAHAHLPLLEPIAQQALFAETVGRPAFLHTYGVGPQKVALLPEFFDHIQESNNAPAHRGIHPSQTTAPGATAEGFAFEGKTAGLTPGVYTGDPGIDRLIEEFKFETFQQPRSPGNWTNPLNLDVANQGDPEQSYNTCNIISSEFRRFMANHGYGSLFVPDQGPVVTEWQDASTLYPNKTQHPGNNHCVNIITTRDGRFTLDWSASQYGYGEVPKIQRVSKTAAWENAVDANTGWDSGIDPLPQNAYIHHGDPMQAKATMDNAALIDTGWSKFQKGDGSDDHERMKQAIVNAFRVVLLSPRKDLRWNAIHYQDIANVPGGVDDPKVYWDTLENSRRKWNESQGIDPEAHMVYYKFLKPFEARIAANHPEKGWEWAKAEAKQTLFNWWTEEQERIQEEDAQKPADKQRHADKIERRANEALARRLQLFLKPKDDKLDVEDTQMSMFGSSDYDGLPVQKTAAGGQYNLLTGQEALKYGAFMGTHLKAIAQISQHADEILNAALADVREHDATGHHFRNKVLQLGVSGVGPKVCSFAWLLLQPLTSQLATIDTHMMDVLGHDYEKEMNNRDYFKFERELAAGRDASGYSHVPLGSFQWGMWDYKRTGPGSHQDHSAMRVLDPKPHSEVDWVGKTVNLKGESWHKQAPDWWQNTQPARDTVAQDWDQTYGKEFAQNQIPYQGLGTSVMAKTNPDEFHVSWNVPDEVLDKLHDWASDQGFSKPEDRSDLHMTALYLDSGHSDPKLHEWIDLMDAEATFSNPTVDFFPSDEDKGDVAVVVKFESNEGKALSERLLDEAEEKGKEVKRFPGGYKPHITVAYADSEPDEKPKVPPITFDALGLKVSKPRVTASVKESYDRPFSYYWDRAMPVGSSLDSKARTLAEYAKADDLSEDEYEDWLDDHKRDTRLTDEAFKRFKKKSLRKFHHISKVGKENARTPSFIHPETMVPYHGMPGQSLMQHARLQTGLSTQEVWKLLADEHVHKA